MRDLLTKRIKSINLYIEKGGISMSNVLEYRNVGKAYGNVQILWNFSMALPEGKIVGLLGPNGSGKTTLIKLAAGLLTPESGAVTVCGYEVGDYTKSLVSYLPERTYFSPWMTGNDMMDYFCDFYADFDRERATEMMQNLHIDLTVPMKHLSKGTKEKVQLILVMSRRAKLYLLDEPIAGVDPAARDYILDTVIKNYQPDSTVLISTHLIYDIENVLDDFIFLGGGRIIMQGSAAAAREETGKTLDNLFREVFRC